jgi:hypothetical protein
MAVRALPRPLTVRWNFVGIAVLATVNLILLAVILAAFLYSHIGSDWYGTYVEAGRRVVAGEPLYEWGAPGYGFRYHPLTAYLFAGLTPLGYAAWAGLHFLPLLALPRTVALIALVSFPFWADVYNGNIMVFVVVAGFLTLSGSRAGTWAFLVLAVIAPRPLMLPVLVWIIWQRPEWRLPFVALAVASLATALLSGSGMEWVAALLSIGSSGGDIGSTVDIGPGLLIGAWWIPLGLALGAWLIWRGHLGWAALAVSPYWLPYYPLVLLWELNRARRHPSASLSPSWLPSVDRAGRW